MKKRLIKKSILLPRSYIKENDSPQSCFEEVKHKYKLGINSLNANGFNMCEYTECYLLQGAIGGTYLVGIKNNKVELLLDAKGQKELERKMMHPRFKPSSGEKIDYCIDVLINYHLLPNTVEAYTTKCNELGTDYLQEDIDGFIAREKLIQ